MPSNVVAGEVFKHYDSWLDRLFAVVKARELGVLVLHSDTEVPRWLRARNVDPWERGNRWVVQLAES